MFSCTIVIPCYNEANRLKTDVFASFMEKHREISFLFVNDGSTDATGEILRTLCENRDNAAFWELPQNRGKAEAVRLGILRAAENGDSGDYIGFWDEDLSTSLEEIPRFLEFAGSGMLMISGCRLRRLGGEIDRTWIRHVLGRTFATIISNYLDLPVYDTQCGAKLYQKDAIREIAMRPFVTRWFFDVEILKRMIDGFGRDTVLNHCCEVPLTRWREVDGSKLKYMATLKDFIKLLFEK